MHCYEGFGKLAKCQAAGTVMVHYTAVIAARAVIAASCIAHLGLGIDQQHHACGRREVPYKGYALQWMFKTLDI